MYESTAGRRETVAASRKEWDVDPNKKPANTRAGQCHKYQEYEMLPTLVRTLLLSN